MIGESSYKILVAAAIAVLLVVQRAAGVYATTDVKSAVGLVASLGLCIGVAELGAPILGMRLFGLRCGPGVVRPARLFAFLTMLLVLHAMSGHTAAILALLRRPPPTTPLVTLIGFWAAAIALVRWRGCSPTSLAVALAGLAVGTRLLAQWIWPFRRLDGDMLWNIDRALDALAAGRFPYLSDPPPMPYLPVTLLAYAPAKALGLDLRYTNLALDAATIVATVHLGRLATCSVGRKGGPSPGQVLLPCLMLHPLWVHIGVNTQYAPCVLATTLLGFAVLLGGFTLQATALGIAVGSNQMIGACGPVLFAYWAGCVGWRRAMGLAALCAAVFLLILGPFLAWDAHKLIDVAFLTRDRFSGRMMAGRFSLTPLVSRLPPQAGPVATVLAVGAASAAAFRARTPSAAIAAAAAGLCIAMMFQPVSFAHYFLPAIVLASIVPPAERCEPPALEHRFQGRMRSLRARAARRALGRVSDGAAR